MPKIQMESWFKGKLSFITDKDNEEKYFLLSL